MAKTLTVRQFAGLCEALPPLLQEAAIRGLRSAGARGVSVVVHEIDHAEPYPAVNVGEMRQAARSEPIPEGAELSVGTPQAVWMEYGTRPHMPPLEPLIVWATRKFVLGGGRKRKGAKRARKAAGGGGGGKNPPKAGPRLPPKHGPRMNKQARLAAKAKQQADNEAIAYAIAKKVQWKIFHHGTAPRGFFAKAMVKIRTKIAPQEVRRELKLLERRL